MDSLAGWFVSYGYVLKWVGFNVFILLMLALDLGVFNRREHAITASEAAIWSTVWIILALLFGVGVFFNLGHQQGVEYLTGYLIEKSLSVDNLFVFLIIFTYFKVEPRFQHSILFWGVLGALVSRAIMIVLGAALIARFQWITYVFGAFLLLTGIRMFRQENLNLNPEENFFVKLTTRFLPITRRFVGNKFFIRDEAGRLTGTLLLL
ncbi:MAG: TerC family protein, partial [Pyrinomonadaceae bacterium]